MNLLSHCVAGAEKPMRSTPTAHDLAAAAKEQHRRHDPQRRRDRLASQPWSGVAGADDPERRPVGPSASRSSDTGAVGLGTVPIANRQDPAFLARRPRVFGSVGAILCTGCAMRTVNALSRDARR